MNTSAIGGSPCDYFLWFRGGLFAAREIDLIIYSISCKGAKTKKSIKLYSESFFVRVFCKVDTYIGQFKDFVEKKKW